MKIYYLETVEDHEPGVKIGVFSSREQAIHQAELTLSNCLEKWVEITEFDLDVTNFGTSGEIIDLKYKKDS